MTFPAISSDIIPAPAIKLSVNVVFSRTGELTSPVFRDERDYW
jgi:hypothetical protein